MEAVEPDDCRGESRGRESFDSIGVHGQAGVSSRARRLVHQVQFLCFVKNLSLALIKTRHRDEISHSLIGLVAFLVMTFGNLLESSRGTQT